MQFTGQHVRASMVLVIWLLFYANDVVLIPISPVQLLRLVDTPLPVDDHLVFVDARVQDEPD